MLDPMQYMHETRHCQLLVVQAPWSEFTQDNASDRNMTTAFCTEALTITAPAEAMTDRSALSAMAIDVFAHLPCICLH